MNEKIKTQLRIYLNMQLRLCKQYMQEQDLTMAKMVWQQAIGATIFASVSVLGIWYDYALSAEIDTMWEVEYREAFDKILFPEVEE